MGAIVSKCRKEKKENPYLCTDQDMKQYEKIYELEKDVFVKYSGVPWD
jgi:hypothetical protein